MSPRRSSPVVAARKNKAPHPSPSPRRRTKSKSRPIKILKRCSSAPLLSRRDNDDGDVDLDGDDHYSRTSGGGSFFRPKTFSDAFLSSPSPFSSPRIHTKQVTLNFTIHSLLFIMKIEMIILTNERTHATLSG